MVSVFRAAAGTVGEHQFVAHLVTEPPGHLSTQYQFRHGLGTLGRIAKGMTLRPFESPALAFEFLEQGGGGAQGECAQKERQSL